MGTGESQATPKSIGLEDANRLKTRFRCQTWAQVPIARKPLWRRIFDSKASCRQSIKGFCQMCQGFENVVESIRACGATHCPLWSKRPYQDNRPKAAD